MVSKTGKKKRSQICNVRKILSSFYFKVFTLLGYIRKVQTAEIRLKQDDDPSYYRELINSTIVAIPRDQSATPPFKPSHTQWFTLKEIINRVIEHCCRSNKSNVLAFGFESLSGNEKSGPVAGTVGIQNSYPNTIVSHLKSSKAWQLLHERIGDDLTIHLLQSVAVFAKGPSKCYFQVAGFPVSRLTPLTDKEALDAPNLSDTQQSRQLANDADDGGATVRRRKTQRGGKRARRSRNNLLIQQEKSFGSGFAGKEGGCNTVEISASSSGWTVNQLDQPNTHKRQASSSADEELCVKKARMSSNVPCLFPVETDVNPMTSAVDGHTINSSCGQNHSALNEHDMIEVTCERNTSEVHVSPTIFPVEEKTTFKRKPCSNAGDKQKVAGKTIMRKPWKILPQRVQGKKCSQENGSLQRKRYQDSNCKAKIQVINFNEVYLPRSRLFYASNLYQGFSKKHIMKTVSMSMTGARILVNHVFLKGIFSEKGSKKEMLNKKNTAGSTSKQKRKPFRLPKRIRSIQPIFLKFIARHQKCPFRTLLRHHCFYADKGKEARKQARFAWLKNRGKKKGVVISVPKRKVLHRMKSRRIKGVPHREKPKVGVTMYRHAVSSYTKQDQVVRFLECVCFKVVPKELWGSSQNKRAFLCNLAKFVRLYRGEKFSLGQMMTGIKVSECKWLRVNEKKGRHVPLSESLKQQKLLAQFIWWFLTQYLIPLLKSFFYITESGMHRQRVFYYRKPVWAKIQQFGINTFCGDFFRPLKTKEAENHLRGKSSLGFSPLRFIPKSSTVRPITNMKHCPTNKEIFGSQKQQSVNRKLQNLFEVLKFEKERNPKLLGATLFGCDDLYRVLKPFVERIRRCVSEKPLYFVHVDVNHCYESIPHQKLFDILKEVLQEEEYLIRRFSLLKLSGEKVFREFFKHVSTADDCRSFPDFFRSLMTAWRLKNVVAVDLVWYLNEDNDKLVDLLREHIFNNIVRIGNKYYQQIRGIAQGSILSTLLCGYFYSHMEKTHLFDLTQDPDSLLLRWVDDFLLITPQKSLAVQFLDLMHAGIPEYGCFINRDKTLTNFEVATADGQQVKSIGLRNRFPWCGYLLDPVTLEVRSDLSRYTGILLRDTLSVALDSHPGQALHRKLLYSVRPKCHPLLLDQELNSRETILLNVYQLFLLIANKFHTYAKELPRGRQPKDNPSFFCNVVLDVAQYFHATSLRKSRQLSPSKAVFSLDEREVTWLCFHAFDTCLRKMQSRYKALLSFLKSGLSRLGRPAEDLKKVTDVSQHTVFKKIR